MAEAYSIRFVTPARLVGRADQGVEVEGTLKLSEHVQVFFSHCWTAEKTRDVARAVFKAVILDALKEADVALWSDFVSIDNFDEDGVDFSVRLEPEELVGAE